MIVRASTARRWASAPLRVSLAGGGTDLPSYYRRHGGRAVGLAISTEVRVSVDATGTGPSDPVASAVFRQLGSRPAGWHSTRPVLPGTGLGSSSAFAAALTAALDDRVDAVAAAETAFAAEHIVLGRPTGKQDPYLSCMGGATSLTIDPDGRVQVVREPITPRLRDFVAERCLLFATGGTRDAAVMLGPQSDGTAAPRIDGALHEIAALVEPMQQALRRERFDDVGSLLHAHWLLKRSLSTSVTNARVDSLYSLARRNGASGGKLAGAGGAGFLLLVAEDLDAVRRLRLRMEKAGLREHPFTLSPHGLRSGDDMHHERPELLLEGLA